MDTCMVAFTKQNSWRYFIIVSAIYIPDKICNWLSLIQDPVVWKTTWHCRIRLPIKSCTVVIPSPGLLSKLLHWKWSNFQFLVPSFTTKLVWRFIAQNKRDIHIYLWICTRVEIYHYSSYLRFYINKWPANTHTFVHKQSKRPLTLCWQPLTYIQ